MAIKWKNSDSNKSGFGIVWILIFSMLAATLMCNMYPYFRRQAKIAINEKEAEIEEALSEDPFFSVDEAFERYIRSAVHYMNYEMTPDMQAYEYLTQNYDTGHLTEEDQENLQRAASLLMKNMRSQYITVQDINEYGSYSQGIDRDFGLEGLREKIYADWDHSMDHFNSGIIISYDSRGIPRVLKSWNIRYDEKHLLEYLENATVGWLMEDNGMEFVQEQTEVTTEGITLDTSSAEMTVMSEAISPDSGDGAELLRVIPLPRIRNATFVFGVHRDMAELYLDSYDIERNAYLHSGYMVAVFVVAAAMVFLALLLQNIPLLHLRKNRLFGMPTELTAFLECMGIGLTVLVCEEMGIYTLSSRIVEDLQSVGLGEISGHAATVGIWLFWAAFALCWYWMAASLLPYITHPIRTLKEELLICDIFRWCKKQWLRFWRWATDIELDEKLTRNIWKLVLVNGVIVMVLCCIWFGGVVGTVLYSIILYVIIKRKYAQIQENYESLLTVTKRIADGDLNTEITEDMGLLNPVRDELAEIQRGFKKAVHEEVRSRNMKTELITNVSHDLKTPLTAIITYVELLKEEDITEEERREYVETLDRKSQRLKVLIEDLFEVSKASSNNITMNFTDVDLVNLIKQVRLENEDKIAESTLDIRWNLPEVKCMLSLDPQRTYRIIDNLLQNILKYSMPHSRVYIELKAENDQVLVSFKNMSAVEMNFSAEEITERFVRGDLSRNTEGSGLGLAIAQSFTELQNGTFKVDIDGDLFKVTLSWNR